MSVTSVRASDPTLALPLGPLPPTALPLVALALALLDAMDALLEKPKNYHLSVILQELYILCGANLMLSELLYLQIRQLVIYSALKKLTRLIQTSMNSMIL